MKLKIETSKHIELIDITSEVQEEIMKSEVSEGICIISTRHTTAGIIINENESWAKRRYSGSFKETRADGRRVHA